MPATVAVIIAAATARWLTVLFAIPAVILLIWQLPPRRRISYQAPAGPSRESGSALTLVRLRLLTVNAQGGAADPVALLRALRWHNVDVLAVQELTPQIVRRLAAAGLAQLLPFSHLDPRPGWAGTGLWSRWPLTPLTPVPGLTAAAPRARIDPPAGRPVTLTAVHPLAPMRGHADMWQRELALIGQTLAMVDGPQVVAGDFNASRDQRPFRDLLAAGFLDCADSSQSRSWPGFTWPDRRGDATRHAPRSCAGLTNSHGAHDSRHTTAPYRSSWRAGRLLARACLVLQQYFVIYCLSSLVVAGPGAVLVGAGASGTRPMRRFGWGWRWSGVPGDGGPRRA